jgi:hypothetical protein
MRSLKNIDPFTDDVMLEIPQANRADLDDRSIYPTAPGATQTKTARFCRAVLFCELFYSPLPKRRDHQPARRGWVSVVVSAAGSAGAAAAGSGRLVCSGWLSPAGAGSAGEALTKKLTFSRTV